MSKEILHQELLNLSFDKRREYLGVLRMPGKGEAVHNIEREINEFINNKEPFDYIKRFEEIKKDIDFI